MTPNTVPSNPRRGLTDPIVANQTINFAITSRSAATSLANTIRSTSSCVLLKTSPPAGPCSLRAPGRSSEKKFTPSRINLPYGDGGSFMTA